MADQPAGLQFEDHGPVNVDMCLEVATGALTGVCKNRHRHTEFLAFLKHVTRAQPDQELHLIMEVERLLTIDHPDADTVVLVMDNLNTHGVGPPTKHSNPPMPSPWLIDWRSTTRPNTAPG